MGEGEKSSIDVVARIYECVEFIASEDAVHLV